MKRGIMASYFEFINRKHCQRGLLLFGCTFLLFLIYQDYKTPLEKRHEQDNRKTNENNVYKLVNESNVFGNNVDSNSSVQLKTFFNTTLHPPGVIVNKRGGIGNQLFLYACSYALAKDLGWPLYLQLDSSFPSQRSFQRWRRDFALDQFQIHFENIIDKTTQLLAQVNAQNDRTFLQRTFLDVPNPINQFVTVGTYCQSIEYWKNYEKEIRAMFQPRKSAINLPNLKQIIKSIEETKESVAIHVRRGDFVGAKGFFVPISYQRYAMRRMIRLLKARGKGKPVFFVFSDDIEHAEEKLKDFAETYAMVYVPQEVTNSTSIEDFYLMTLCKHIIIPNSTYSWWAAYLIKNVDKIVIASAHNPRYFGGLLGKQDYFFDSVYGKLYHPKEWIVINPFTGGLDKDGFKPGKNNSAN